MHSAHAVVRATARSFIFQVETAARVSAAVIVAAAAGEIFARAPKQKPGNITV